MIGAIRLPIDPGDLPLDDLERLVATPSAWMVHRLGSNGGWLLAREDREIKAKDYPGIGALCDLVPAKRKRFWVSMLKAGCSIREHNDSERAGATRVHIPLQGECVLMVAGEPVRMKVGEAWAVDTVPHRHSAQNDGAVDRVHLLVDVFPNDWIKAHVPWI